MAHVSLSKFAEIKGVSVEAVRKAIKTGRLKNAIQKSASGKDKVDPDIALLEWERNTNQLKRTTGRAAEPPPPKQAEYFAETIIEVGQPEKLGQYPSINESNAKLIAYKANLAQIEFEEKAGKLITVEEVKDNWYKIITAAKTKLFAVPSKAKNNIPHLDLSDVEVLHRLIREALEDLANGSD